MKRYSFWVKSLVFFLAVVTFLSVAVSGLGIFMAESMSLYSYATYQEWRYSRSENMAQTLADQVMREYAGRQSGMPQWLLEQAGYLYAIQNGMGWYELSEEDWYYTVTDPSGRVVAGEKKEIDNPLTFIFGDMSSSYPVIVDMPDVPVPETTEAPSVPALDTDTTEPATEPVATIVSHAYDADAYYDVFYTPSSGEEVYVQYYHLSGYQVNICVREDHDCYYVSNGFPLELMKWVFTAKYHLIAVAAVGLLLFAVAFVLLMLLAGKNPKTGEADPKALNRLPLDLYLAAAGMITVFGGVCAYELLDAIFGTNSYNMLMIVLICGCGIAVATADVGFFMALAAQLKVPGGFWWRHSFCGWALKWVWKVLRAVFAWLKKAFRFCGCAISRLLGMLPVIWEWLLIGFVLVLGLFIALLLCCNSGHPFFLLVLLWWCAIGALVIGYGGWCYGNIRKGVRRMKEGDLNEKIRTEWMFGSFKSIAEDLNALADVVAVAAEKQLRSERMKTELITNVSHDIKTPLTSVINYVDLLQQPHTEEEGAQYLEVLSRQSQRLKKLVEDLMDMSKASTGNVAVNITNLDAVETVNQALGEFADKLEAANLTPVFRSPDSQLHMRADGKLTWRVLSNLLSNVVKYALPGTRVYLDLLRLDKCVVLSVKNISREELNISAEELTERFVRGDASRNTEGSGLGLNIAQNLMALQRGTMDITVDGDLFKVTLTFPTE